MEMKENILKRVFQQSKETSRNQTVLLKFHQRDKYLGCPLCKILGTILEMNKGTSTNGPESKETYIPEMT